MSDPDFHVSNKLTTVQQRVAAVQAAFDARGLLDGNALSQLEHATLEEWIPLNGARIVAKAWSDAGFRDRLLSHGRAAIDEMNFPMPQHHRHVVALENTPTLQNVVCCTLCSCTPFTIIGVPPDWYKDLEYRARVVRQSRTVLKEMGLDLPPEVEIRVWDTTADTRYLVIPVRPMQTQDWSEADLAKIVTRDGMIGVALI